MLRWRIYSVTRLIKHLAVLLSPHLIPATREYSLGRLPLGIGVHILLDLLLAIRLESLLLHGAKILFSGVREHVGCKGEAIDSEVAVHVSFGSLYLVLGLHDEAKLSCITFFILGVVNHNFRQIGQSILDHPRENRTTFGVHTWRTVDLDEPDS